LHVPAQKARKSPHSAPVTKESKKRTRRKNKATRKEQHSLRCWRAIRSPPSSRLHGLPAGPRTRMLLIRGLIIPGTRNRSLVNLGGAPSRLTAADKLPTGLANRWLPPVSSSATRNPSTSHQSNRRTYLFVKSVGSALLAARMALAADGFAGQWLQRTLLLRTDPFVVIAVRTRLRLLQASLLYRAKRSNVSPFLSLNC